MGVIDRDVLRVGVVTPHAAPGPEVELPVMAPGRLTAVVARVPTGVSGAGTAVDLPTAARAVASFGAGAVDAVALASTGSSYLLGHRAETELVDALRLRCGVPVVSSGTSVVRALRALGADRVAVVHPAWFDARLAEPGEGYFREQGFEASVFRADGLPEDPAAVRSGPVVDWVVQHLGDEFDAVFIGGNGFRAAGAIAELERRTGLPVLEANQVLLWSITRLTRTPWVTSGYGRLFRT